MTEQTKDPIQLAIDALEKAEKRHEKIRNALDFIRYGSFSRKDKDGNDGPAMADAGNHLSAARHEVNEALRALQSQPAAAHGCPSGLAIGVCGEVYAGGGASADCVMPHSATVNPEKCGFVAGRTAPPVADLTPQPVADLDGLMLECRRHFDCETLDHEDQVHSIHICTLILYLHATGRLNTQSQYTATPADIQWMKAGEYETVRDIISERDELERLLQVARQEIKALKAALRDLDEAATKVCFLSRTAGGTAGPDGPLCDGLGRLESCIEKHAATIKAAKEG